MSRHLTSEDKDKELAAWDRTISDPEIIPWCNCLNKITGVCTIQSCAGHKRKDGSLGSAHFWLWLDEATNHRFQKLAMNLAKQDCIERVATIYQPWGKEIVEIRFRGNEYGQLEESCTAIVAFFEGLSRLQPILRGC